MKKHIMILSVAFIICACSSGNSNLSSVSNSSIEDHISSSIQQTGDPTGSFNELGIMRQTQGKKGLPQSGKANVLVVPVEFKNDSTYGYNFSKTTLSLIDYLYFGKTSQSATTVKDFYKKSSYGKLTIDGEVTSAFVSSKTILDVINEYNSKGAQQVISEILEEVYNFYFVEKNLYKVDDYDSDKDGMVDGIVLCYSWGNSLSYYGTDMYSYVHGLLENETLFEGEVGWNAKVNSTTWISSMIPDLTGDLYDAHMYVTEMGKMIGLESYQDQTGSTSGYVRMPLGLLDRMDGYIGDHNPFSKYALGWIEPQSIFADKLTKDETITLKPFESTGDCLVLAPSETGLFGEYLLVTYYTPTGLNEYDSTNSYSYFNNKLYSQNGIRVYAVDSRLVEGKNANDVSLVTDKVDFDKLSKDAKYIDFAFSNSGVNEYSDSGIFENYPLIGELSKNELNRHFIDYSYSLDDSDLFIEGDIFGDDTDLEFYKNYSFHGNGVTEEPLGLTFSVDAISDNATLTIRRAK